jgi:hypothetical protein
MVVKRTERRMSDDDVSLPPSAPPPRKPGRPALAEKTSAVGTRLSASLHDRLIAAARERDESVSATLRRLVERTFKTRV